MNVLDFFSSYLEEFHIRTESEEYNEGYNEIIQEIHYGIRSKSIKSLNDLIEYINQYDAFIEDYNGEEYKRGSQDAINRCIKYLAI
jgi:hypothetical protein